MQSNQGQIKNGDTKIVADTRLVFFGRLTTVPLRLWSEICHSLLRIINSPYQFPATNGKSLLSLNSRDFFFRPCALFASRCLSSGMRGPRHKTSGRAGCHLRRDFGMPCASLSLCSCYPILCKTKMPWASQGIFVLVARTPIQNVGAGRNNL
jgi:hypothetical protein